METSLNSLVRASLPIIPPATDKINGVFDPNLFVICIISISKQLSHDLKKKKKNYTLPP